MSAQQQTDAKASLGRFLADNPELGKLEARLATFNIFNVLRIEHEEIRHSNTLAWLLDPAESHGLGSLVLRRVLSSALLDAGTDIQGLSAAGVELLDFSTIDVRREWHHFDIFVLDQRNKLFLLVENKVWASVSHKQLRDYLAKARAEFPAFTAIPIVLTLREWDAGEELPEPWIPYSYSQLLAVLEQVLSQREAHPLADPVGTFLRHYMDTLRRLTMQDKAITELCRAIYRKHRKAIDLIVEYGKVSRFQDVVSEALSQGSRYQVLLTKPARVEFLPQGWKGVVPEGDFWKSIWCWVTKRHDRIGLGFEVGKMEDTQMRQACVTALHNAGFKLIKKAFRPEAQWSRFFNATEKVADFDDEEGIRNAAEALLKKAEAQIAKAADVFKVVFKD